MMGGRPEQEDQREAPAAVQVTEPRTGTVRVDRKQGTPALSEGLCDSAQIQRLVETRAVQSVA